jgi:hypothetical protein
MNVPLRALSSFYWGFPSPILGPHGLCFRVMKDQLQGLVLGLLGFIIGRRTTRTKFRLRTICLCYRFTNTTSSKLRLRTALFFFEGHDNDPPKTLSSERLALASVTGTTCSKLCRRTAWALFTNSKPVLLTAWLFRVCIFRPLRLYFEVTNDPLQAMDLNRMALL